MRVPVRRKPSGFTLVEMAIVLVIIGIILAGVMKGRDIVRGSQVKQFSQQFAQKWGTVAQTYYDKTGQFLNDGNVNGGVAAGVPDGQMDASAASAAQSANILLVTRNVGIPVCSLVKSKLITPVATNLVAAAAEGCGSAATYAAATAVMNPWQTTVEGEYTGTLTVDVDLVGIRLTQNGIETRRNVVALFNVPVDVAVGLDTAIDGKNDGTSGTFVGLATGAIGTAPAAIAANTQVTATAWPAGHTAGVANWVTAGIILDF